MKVKNLRLKGEKTAFFDKVLSFDNQGVVNEDLTQKEVDLLTSLANFEVVEDPKKDTVTKRTTRTTAAKKTEDK